MLDDNHNEENIEKKKRVKWELSVKNCVRFAVFGCVCLLLAWWTIFVAEPIYAGDYSDTRVMFFVAVFLVLFTNPLYKIWAGFCLSGCFIFCLFSLGYGIALLLLYVRIKREKKTVESREKVSRTAFALCMISVIISVAVIALGVWLAVRLSLIGK